MWKRCILLPVCVVALGMIGAVAHADNQLRNWEFDEPLAGAGANWWLWETADFERVEPVPDETMSGGMSLRIVIPDGAAGSLQLIQSYLELVQGETYYISFMGRADAPRTVAMMLLGRTTHNWNRFWFVADIALTTEVQTFTFEYEHTGPTVGGTGNFNDDIDLYFNLNASDIDLNIDRVWMDTVPPPEIEVPVAARQPDPANMETDVPIDALLRWTAGEYAATHDVYLGAASDVEAATRADPRDVLRSEGQADTAFDADGLLDYGRTYYWRVDEVNAAPDSTIFPGDVWSFTVEPFAYPLANVTATASSAQPGMGAQNTVNGSGLNANDEHSTVLTEMWMSAGVQPNWIQYEFDAPYKLHELWVWNSNQLIEAFVGFGARDVTIEYSTDGQTWTTLADAPEFARAPGVATYQANTIVDFGGVMARYVRLTINSTWGAVAPQASLSEVRFFYVPVRARNPEPAVAATDVLVDADLSWRPGRDATSHEVYLGTGADALTLADTVTEHSYTPASLDFGTTYFWQVNEIGESGTHEGPVWSFTTQEFATIDDMESYNDDDNRIYDTWIDGLTDPALGGSQVGYDVSPFAEQGIVHGGAQSMPLSYNNESSPFYSEAQREFSPVQDWTARGADSLILWVRGDPTANSPADLYVIVEDSAGKKATVTHPTAVTAATWTLWIIPQGDLASVNLARVKKMTIGVGSKAAPTAGGTGLVFIDDLGFGRPVQ